MDFNYTFTVPGGKQKTLPHTSHSIAGSGIHGSKVSPSLFTYDAKQRSSHKRSQKKTAVASKDIALTPRSFSKTMQALSMQKKPTTYHVIEKYSKMKHPEFSKSKESI
jgi:hypothetical protein